MNSTNIKAAFTSFILSICAQASDFGDVASFSSKVFKGGNTYSQEEIESVANNNQWSEHHRIILEVQMLASMDDPTRYQKAINIATGYIDSGTIDWVKSYLRMQRGFLYNLSGDRESGNQDLQAVVDGELLTDFGSIDDPVVAAMKLRHGNLELSFDSVMRQSIGHYYLDFNKDGTDSVKAFHYFNGIKNDKLREKCMIQLKNRIGDDFDKLYQKKVSRNYTDESSSSCSTLNNYKSTQPQRAKKKKIPINVQTDTKPSKSNFYIFLIAAATLLACSIVWCITKSRLLVSSDRGH